MTSHRNRGRCVVFRVDGGGYGVAMGHVFRCLRLAKQLLASEVRSVFCIRGGDEVKSLIESQGHQAVLVEQLPGYFPDGVDSAVCGFAESFEAVLYIDLRGEKRPLVEAARARGMPVVVYDDIYEKGLCPDLLINPSECDRAHYSGGSVEYLLGSQYIILDPGLHSYRKSRCSARINKVFVCFGGADPCNVTARVVRAILSDGYDGEISVALGPGYQSVDEMKSLAAEAGNVALHQGVNFLAPLMSAADAAIASGGTVMCEAIALALPVLVLPTIAHEVAIADTYKAKGLVASVSCDVNLLEEELLGLAIERFLASATGRKELFSAQAADVGFNGCEAIAEKLCRLLRGVPRRQIPQ